MNSLIFGSLLVFASVSLAASPQGKVPAPEGSFEFEELPEVATAPSGDSIKLGGFSGLRLVRKDPKSGKMTFITHTDRGPNLDDFEKDGVKIRPFLSPSFTPRLVRIEVDPATKSARVVSQTPLRWDSNGQAATGIPHPNVDGEKPRYEKPVAVDGSALPTSKLGLDLESLTRAPDGTYWMGDEYGPSLLQVNDQGRILKRIGPESLPEVFGSRKMNRGFESLTMRGKNLLVFLEAPPTPLAKTKRTLALELDPRKNQVVGVYAYEYGNEGTEKVNDACTDDKGNVYLLEQNSKTGKGSVHKVYKLDFTNAKNLAATKLDPDTVTQATPIGKQERADLVRMGFDREKIEGLACLDDGSLAVVSDNDFGVAGEMDPKTGEIKMLLTKERPGLFFVPPKAAETTAPPKAAEKNTSEAPKNHFDE